MEEFITTRMQRKLLEEDINQPGLSGGLEDAYSHTIKNRIRSATVNFYHQKSKQAAFRKSLEKYYDASRVTDAGNFNAAASGRIGGILTGGCASTDSIDITYLTPMSYIMKTLHKSEPFANAHLDPTLSTSSGPS
jgi:hypothetical protein